MEVGTSVRELDERIVEEYLLGQRRRGYTDLTLDAKRLLIDRYRGWLAPRGLGDATYVDVEAFLDSLTGRGGGAVVSRTRYARLSQLHVFYEFSVAHELLERDPTVRAVRPKLSPLFPRPIADDDLVRALEHCGELQMRVWLLLMAYGGLRCCEISRLERADVFDTNETPVLRVRGKGRKDRWVPAHPLALEALQALGMPTRGRVFRRPSGGIWPAKHVSIYTNRYLAGLGIDATAHQLRHWFGTRLYADTKDLRMVQEVMGHSDPKTTADYTAWAEDEAYTAVVRLDVYRSKRRRRQAQLPGMAAVGR